MNLPRLLFLFWVLKLVILADTATAAEPGLKSIENDWKISAGVGLIVAPAFVGAREYSLLAVPDIRVSYKDVFFANIKDGVGYAVVNHDGWRVGPVLSYTFSRSEKRGGTVFRVAGGSSNALEGMGNVPGTVSLGGFAEYSLNSLKMKLRLHKGVTGHEGVAGEAGINYGGILALGGPPLIYSFGPHIKCGDQKYTNAYWGISPEQSARTGLAQYHADAGITAYGADAFALISWTKAVSLTAIAGFDRLAPLVDHSPLVRVRGTKNQAFGGMFVNYAF